MKNQLLTVLSLVGLVASSAIPVAQSSSLEVRDHLEVRQGSSTSNELKNGNCRDFTFIFARGSTEPGNMGSIPGPPTCSSLKSKLGSDSVACQGVGSEDGYPASLTDNFLSGNTSPGAIAAATKMFNLAAEKCPSTKIVAGGYSQGTAVMDNAIQNLPANMQSKIYGVVLFGFTRNAQDKGRIPNLPENKVKVFCAAGDMVCENTLTITPAHMTYAANAGEAADFLANSLKA